MAEKVYSVLLVDDSLDDRLFARRALCKNPRFTVVAELCDGQAAIDYLSGHGEYNDRGKFPIPNVVLLDLKLPRKTGHEVLQWIRSQDFENLRVVILSGSFLPEDVIRSRELGADAYFKKEALTGQQEAVISAMQDILEVNACPSVPFQIQT